MDFQLCDQLCLWIRTMACKMALFAGFMPFIVMTGMHWAFLPTALMGLAGVGYDIMLLPAMLVKYIVQAGNIWLQ